MSKPYAHLKVAAVVPRYDLGLGGGAETLVMSLVENLRKAVPTIELEVWTTCARDHRSWENHYQSGETIINDVLVRRFSVDDRNLDLFIKYELMLQEGQRLSVEEQLEWLESGVNSIDLYRHIKNEGRSFDVIFFAPYLFPTSFWGALIHPDKSVLIPCLHHERYAYLDVTKFLFRKVLGLMYNSNKEKLLAESLYGSQSLRGKGFVVGMSFDNLFGLTAKINSTELFSRYPGLSRKYILYSGRKETGKNLDLLVEMFTQYKCEAIDADLQLVIIGSGEIDFVRELPRDIIDLGFVSEDEKVALLDNALALCQPSVNESFSIVIMEAWLRGIPVIVHNDCDVTKDHVNTSGGGFVFGSQKEFSLILQQLINGGDNIKKIGELGRLYVHKEYCWNSVFGRLSEGLKLLGITND